MDARDVEKMEERENVIGGVDPADVQTTLNLAAASKFLDTKLSGMQLRLKREHPALWEVLQRRITEPLDLKIKGLVRDVVYEQLVAQTNKECDLINLVNVLVPVALRLVNSILPILV